MAELGFDDLTADARRMVVYAMHIGIEMKERQIGSEHLLLGILRVAPPLAERALQPFDLDSSQVVESLQPKLGRFRRKPKNGTLPMNDDAKLAIAAAFETATELGSSAIGVAHFLVGIVSTPTCRGAVALADLGVDLVALQESESKQIGTIQDRW